MTVIPSTRGAEASSDARYVGALSLIGILVFGSIGVVVWLKRRRGGSLQEQ
ncbi:hypothetical protein BH18ACT13_BH18ACT13_14160 [soil metagenome]